VDTKNKLKFTKHKGYENRRIHMQIFEDESLVNILDRELLTNLFPLTMKGNTPLWFNKLPNIQYFPQLKRSFYKYFKDMNST